MELQVGVKILLKNRQGKYLLALINPKKYPEIGAKWDIIGGRIIPGSPLFENLCREVKEEIGLDLKLPIKLVGAQDILRIAGRHVVRLTYVGEIDGTAIVDEEHLEARWFSAEEIKGLGDSLDLYFRELLEKNPVILE